MREVEQKYKAIRAELDNCLYRINHSKLKQEYKELDNIVQDTSLWDNPEYAKSQVEKHSKLSQKIEPWDELIQELDEISELINLEDASLVTEINLQLDKIKEKIDKFKHELAFNGPYDDHDAVMSIYAGAGGTDAQDWASILLRMYSRWAEKSNIKTRVLDETSGDEAGLKSVRLQLSGKNVYGKLKGEHGVHRLVRLSPFNANNLRQTSFAKVEVLPKISKPEEVPLDDKDINVDVFRAGGHGGQSVNTTDSAVRVTHTPTGVTVSIQNERSQQQNKETAMTILRSKLAQLKLQQHAQKINDLKGPKDSNEWGSQIRNYVLHPYNMVKDLRTMQETTSTNAVLDGDIEQFIEAYINSIANN